MQAVVDPLKNRLETWKRALIDLTKRNRLLNYKASRITTIQAINELPEVLFRVLHIENKSIKFLPLTKEAQTELSDLPMAAENGAANSISHKDRHLQTKLSVEKLDESLRRVFHKAASLFEEQGISTLFISLGILEWVDDDNTLLQAPLLLLPVELTRTGIGQDFILKATQDDPVLNPALVEQLRLAHELILPELPESFDDFDLNQYLIDIQGLISKKPRWKVNNDIYLDFFSFQKFLMYKDMERYEDIYYGSPLIQALCKVSNQRIMPLPENIENADLDRTLLPESTFHILDADSSQQRAILAVKSKYDLVIEGPPGTGKSQTIANMIADALADGKSVLFVSEKMAALDVVYKRLQSLGLHDFCLQLHSHRTNKRAVYDEIIRVLDNQRPRDHAKDADLTELNQLRTLLNQYANELHTPFGKLGEKPFDVLGQLALVLGKAPLIKADLLNIDQVDQLTLRTTCSNLRDLVEVLLDLGEPDEHPWHDSELTNISNAGIANIQEALTKAESANKTLMGKVHQYADEIGTTKPQTLDQVSRLCEIALAIVNSPGISQLLLESDRWNDMPLEASDILSHGHNYSALKKQIVSYFSEDVLNLDVAELRGRLNNYSASWTRFLKPDYWRDRQFLLNHIQRDHKPKDGPELLKHVEAILQYQAEKSHLEQLNELGKDLFAERWQGIDSNWSELQNYANWLVQVRKYIKDGLLESKAIESIINRSLNTKQTRERVENIQQELGYLVASVQEVIKLGQFSDTSSKFIRIAGELDELDKWLNQLLANIGRLHQWIIYKQSMSRCLSSLAGPMVVRFIEEKQNLSFLETTFKRFFYERWLDLVFTERPQLGKFTSLIHEQKIEDFRSLDANSINLARKRLLHHLYKRREMELAKPTLSIELSTLQRELRKKARHVPLRKLCSKTPNVIRAIKPCFMMSPLSAAWFIDPNIFTFDLVIFDEASQVSTEDAVGSLVRAQQAVVVGDPKQLPPTNFFQMQIAQTNEYAPEEEDVIDEVDSVLDEFVSVGFPKKPLLWHYRSQHESLIEFSNRHFYKNLLTFPAPHTGTNELGLQFTFVNGIYQGQGINPIEATVVANAVCQHIKEHPNLSLGVGTFNMNQQQLILDELEKRRQTDPSLEFFFAKKGEDQFFVKNLENIQGDERDVIFISITYGPDEAGRIKYNFGPVNGENGWRRLNVIFTRAKRCLKVFSSMHGEAIDPTKVQSEGAKLLREFLIFAKRQWDLATTTSEVEIESPFEQAVYDQLTKQGLRLVPYVGQSGYKIDFGVLDNEITGRFIAGIECDGTNYHNASTARDRNRLRDKVLRDLGWTIIRIWSVDWWRDKDAQIERVLKSIAQARAKYAGTVNKENIEALKIDDLPSEKIDFSVAERAVNFLVEPIVNSTNIGAFAGTGAFASKPTDSIALNVPPYKLTLLSPYGNADDFNQASSEQITEALKLIVAREAPIHMAELMRRIGSFWQITRLTKKIKDKLETDIHALVQSNYIIIKDNFIWSQPEPKTIVRNRQGLDYIFDAEHVCKEEYEYALLMVLEAYGTRTKEELIRETVRLLGFTRLSQKISEPISKNIDNLFSQGKITNAATGLILVKGLPNVSPQQIVIESTVNF